MSTQIVTRPDYLPAMPGLDPLAAAASAGVGGRMFKALSFKQSRFRVIDEEGTEKVLETFALPLAILAVNPAVSKTYYIKAYSPGDDPVAPDCWSDDGRTPDISSQHMQAQSCAACKQNVWGSAVNPQNGKPLKACKDAKRMSVAIPGDPSKSAYSVRLSAMNMQSFAKFVREKVLAQGIRLDHIIVKASFDSTAEFPLLQFEVLRNMTLEEYQTYGAMRQTDEAKGPAGLGEKIITVEAPVQTVQAPVQASQPVVHPDIENAFSEPIPAQAIADAEDDAKLAAFVEAEKKKRGRPARSNVVVEAPAPSADMEALLAKAFG